MFILRAVVTVLIVTSLKVRLVSLKLFSDVWFSYSVLIQHLYQLKNIDSALLHFLKCNVFNAAACAHAHTLMLLLVESGLASRSGLLWGWHLYSENRAKKKKKKEPQMHTETRTQEMFKYGFAQFEHLPCETLSSLSLALLCSYTCDPQQQSRVNHV